MLIVSTTGATHVSDIEGVDGVFDVPQDVAVHLLGFPGWRRPTEEETAGFPVEAPPELKGAALDAALTDAGLSKTGTADEKRAALAEAAAPLPELKGEALAAALEEAGLPKSGTADEKRAALAETSDG